MNTPVLETEPFSGPVRTHILHKDAPESIKPLGVSECQDTSPHSINGPGGSDACVLGDSISPVEGTTKRYHKAGTIGSEMLGPETNADQKSIAQAEVSRIIHEGIASGQVEHDSTPPMWVLPTGNQSQPVSIFRGLSQIIPLSNLPEPHTHTFATATSPFMQEHPQAF